MNFGLTYSILLHILIILVMMFGLDHSRKILPQEETVLLELIPISSVTNVKTTINDVKPVDKKKELISKNDAKQDTKTVLKDSEFDNGNSSKKQPQQPPKQEPTPKQEEKIEPKQEIPPHIEPPAPPKKEEPKAEQKPKTEEIQKNDSSIIEKKDTTIPPTPKQDEPKKDTQQKAVLDNKEKVPTKDIKKEPEPKKQDDKKDEKPVTPPKKEDFKKSPNREDVKTSLNKEDFKKSPKKEDSKKSSQKEDSKQSPTPKKDDKQPAKDAKKVDKPKPKPKPEDASDDELVNSVLKSLNEGGKKSSKAKPKQGQSLDEIMENAIKGDTTTDYDSNSELSMSEIALIRSQISQAWRVTSFSGGNNKSMKVTIKVDLEPSGEVKDIKIVKKNMPSSVDVQVYNAFVDSVMRAVRSASPLHSLPSEKYNTWGEMELVFDSSGMIY